MQWGACKWGLPDNLVRAIAAAESTWYQYLTYPSGKCYTDFGCGDYSDSDATYCTGISQSGYNYTQDYSPGTCPGTFSIAGVMSYENPDWGAMQGNQNGTFPFNRDSTAFAVDYMAATIRGCFEGWMKWLTTPFPAYTAGDLWGCVGVWSAGEWHTSGAEQYIQDVKNLEAQSVWLQSSWLLKQYSM